MKSARPTTGSQASLHPSWKLADQSAQGRFRRKRPAGRSPSPEVPRESLPATMIRRSSPSLRTPLPSAGASPGSTRGPRDPRRGAGPTSRPARAPPRPPVGAFGPRRAAGSRRPQPRAHLGGGERPGEGTAPGGRRCPPSVRGDAHADRPLPGLLTPPRAGAHAE